MTTSGRGTIGATTIAAVIAATMLAAPGPTDAKPREDKMLAAAVEPAPKGRDHKQETESRLAIAPVATPTTRLEGAVKAAEKASRKALRAVADPTPAPVVAPAATAVAAVEAPAVATPEATPIARAAPAKRKTAKRRHAVRRPRPVVATQRPAPAPTPVVQQAAPAKPPARAARPKAKPQRTEPAAQRVTRPLPRLVTRFVEVIPRPVRTALVGLGALAAALVLAFLAAMLHARRLERRRRRLVEDVGLLQSALLPQLPERIGPATVTAAYRPAEGLAAGGDFYDAFALDEHRTCVMIGDVAGHGRDAIPVTASVRYTVRAYLEGGLSPRQALQIAGRVLDPQLRDTLVTVLVAVYDVRTGLLTSAAAGHPPAIVTTDGAAPPKSLSSPAFGLGTPTGRREVTVALPPGSAACFYTDGLADVVVSGGRLGFDTLAKEIRTLEGGAGELIDRLVQRSSSQPDDMAAVVLRPPLGAPAARNLRIEELELEAADVERGRLDRFFAEYGVTDGVAEAAKASVLARLASADRAVIEVEHEPGGAVLAVRESSRVAVLPLEDDADVSRDPARAAVP